MSSFAPQVNKNQTENNQSMNETKEWFSDVKKIEYEGPKSKNALAFKFYQPDLVVHGKKMKDWFRFSVCYWHTFRGTGADPFGAPTVSRPWDDQSNSLENAKRRLRAAFEFFQKLGVEYYTFHDRDIAPEGANLQETNANLDAITDLALELQQKTGIKLLWGTANLFSHPRYANGAATNPDAHVFAYAGAQVKKMMEVTKKLGGENFVFWGGREGYQSILNTDVKRELDHAAQFFRMAAEYKKKIGATFQLLIEPKPKEPSAHQYDYDAQTVMGFLKTYNLDQDFKLNIEPNHTTLAGHDYEHDLVFASRYGMLGSIDANTGSPNLGWDTDQFPSDLRKTAQVMRIVMSQGGIAPGGLNFDCKVRRESFETEDLFIAHIGAMDAFARGLLIAVGIEEDGRIPNLVSARYASFDSGVGKSIEQGKTTFEDLEKFIHENGEPQRKSGKQELCENIFNELI